MIVEVIGAEERATVHGREVVGEVRIEVVDPDTVEGRAVVEGGVSVAPPTRMILIPPIECIYNAPSLST